ncbi:hypothetical protein ACFZC3_15160 [Streptomyces sp. NPDC007903]|uniref:hypothetical protein n=1 Tax=Streptomyces sp. NPDC007903 TaxID=3364786 RepID=UPI0036EA024E
MRYAVITPDGTLTHGDDVPDWDALVGPEGEVRVSLGREVAAAAWVNDCGLRFPDRYPRNITGSCLLTALGANIQPYAGTIVVTGWDPSATPRGELEIRDLPLPVEFLDIVHGDVVKALGGQTPRDMSPSWAEQMREIADHVRTAPAPGITTRPVTL